MADQITTPRLSNTSPLALSAPVGAFLLHLTREHAYPDRTVGKLFVDGVWQWWTLEDALRSGPKIPGLTAIPAGCYRVIMSMSQRFGKVMPEILQVPGFTGIRMHGGNTPGDTAGCPLLAGAYDPKTRTVSHCAEATRAVSQTITDQIARGRQVWIEIIDPPMSGF